MEPINNLKTAVEAASIIRGVHPDWRGDRLYNAAFFLRGLVDRHLGVAEFAQDLEQAADLYSAATGLSQDRVQWMAARVREGVASKSGPRAVNALFERLARPPRAAV